MPNLSDLPNFNYSAIRAIEGCTVTVAKVPDGVKTGSKVRLHGPGSYLYARKVGTDGEWNKYSITLNGIASSFSANSFWKGTRYAGMVLIVNGEGAVEVRNAKIIEVK